MIKNIIKTIFAAFLIAESLACSGDAFAPPTTTKQAPEIKGGVPVWLQHVSGNQQSAPAGTLLPDWVVVRVLDAKFQPVADWPVAFAVVDNSGRVLAQITDDTIPGTRKPRPYNDQVVVIYTDDDGQAQVRWVIGARSGEHRLMVQPKSKDLKTFIATPVSFFATAE